MQAAPIVATLLWMLTVHTTKAGTSEKPVDTMKMLGEEVDIVPSVCQPQPPAECDGEDASVAGPDCTVMRQLFNTRLRSSLGRSNSGQPDNTQVAQNPMTNQPTKTEPGRSIRNIRERAIITDEHPSGLLYISENAGQQDFHKMLSSEDLEDAMGLAFIPGYKMRNEKHLASRGSLLNFLNLALDNVWSLEQRADNHPVLWDNTFRVFIEVCTGTSVKLPENHESTCSCYKMSSRLLAMCKWARSHDDEEPENTAEFSTDYMCPVLFRLLPILNIRSVHIEKPLNVCSKSLGHVMDAGIERLSVEDGSCREVELPLNSLIQRGDNGQVLCKNLRTLKAPGWKIWQNEFIEMIYALKQLESIDAVEVKVLCPPEEAIRLLRDLGAGGFWQKCDLSWYGLCNDLYDHPQLLDAIRDAGIRSMSVRPRCSFNASMEHTGRSQNIRIVDCCDEARCINIDLYRALKVLRAIPSLEKFNLEVLAVRYRRESRDAYVGKFSGNTVSAHTLCIEYCDSVIPESLLDLLWEILGDSLDSLEIQGKAVEALPAPKARSAFANKFKNLQIYDLHFLSADMCSHLGAIGGSVDFLYVRQTEHSNIPVCGENEKLAALLGVAGGLTPLGKSITFAGLFCDISEPLCLGPLLHCDKLKAIHLYFHGPGNGQTTDEEIGRVAAEVNKLVRKDKGLELDLHISDLSACALLKLLRQICPGSDPARIINNLWMYRIKGKELVDEVRNELKRYVVGGIGIFTFVEDHSTDDYTGECSL